MKVKKHVWPLLFALFLLPALACGGGGNANDSGNTGNTGNTTDTSDTVVATTTQPPAVPTDTPAPPPTEVSLAVGSLQDVKKAVVQIIAQGTFRDPAEGFQ